MCGETHNSPAPIVPGEGPSPRVRGNHLRAERHRDLRGSIPACAGKPAWLSAIAWLTWVHPRVCGETHDAVPADYSNPGPSPRVRGNRRRGPRRCRCSGSIPACAGNPPNALRTKVESGVHPRVCGETRREDYVPQIVQGPSPRVRGNRRAGHRVDAVVGSIPACAGKPVHRRPLARAAGVHPRVCGETPRVATVSATLTGPSPRVRGNRRAGSDGRRSHGSIPACAGKPSAPPGRSSNWRVHPRVCGETPAVTVDTALPNGPSPRVRGNPYALEERRRCAGSIPACAGKPPEEEGNRHGNGVHPRVCGETLRKADSRQQGDGPSPRVRGNRVDLLLGLRVEGSIPACAGKPGRSWRPSPGPRVHPRVCGETRCRRSREADRRGPSPRVRGNRPTQPAARHREGSIPACAGKPPAKWPCSRAHWVHPRVCGETSGFDHDAGRLTGPSPRVRGNLRLPGRVRRGTGSIPACAGKPSGRTTANSGGRVHPRVCGETRLAGGPPGQGEGPSPRVRGNPGPT